MKIHLKQIRSIEMLDFIKDKAKWAWSHIPAPIRKTCEKATSTLRGKVLGGAIGATVLATIYNNPITVRLIGFLSLKSDQVTCYFDRYHSGSSTYDRAIGIDFRSGALASLALTTSFIWSLAISALLYISFRRADAVKKLKSAAARKAGGVKALKDKHNAKWLPEEVRALLELPNQNNMSKQEKFAVLEKYIKSEYPADILEAMFAEDDSLVGVTNDFDDTLLHVAAQTGHSDIVNTFIERGFNPFLENKRGEKPRVLAHDADPSVVKILFDYEQKRWADIVEARRLQELEAGEPSQVSIPVNSDHKHNESNSTVRLRPQPVTVTTVTATGTSSATAAASPSLNPPSGFGTPFC